jgi:hypothetical protein
MNLSSTKFWLVIVTPGLLLLGLAFVGSYISASNYGASQEAALQAARDNAKNAHADAIQQVQGVAQVPAMMRDDLVELTRTAREGRYGPDGSQAVTQWIQEQNPSIPADVYVSIQQTIRGTQTNIRLEQTRMIDIRRQYTAQLESVWRGYWLKKAGYPKLRLSDFDVVTTDETERAFETKRQEPIQLR